MRKYDIINDLGRRFRLRRYLEICTPTTGLTFGLVDAEVFEVRHRFLYNCPEQFEDGYAITFRTAASSSFDVLSAIDTVIADDRRYDLIFVDPYHSYAATLSDLHGARLLLRPGGIIVVHDCYPNDAALVSPEFVPGKWCGVTYQAFLDFVLAVPDARYCVVDTDYGCGIVFDVGDMAPENFPAGRPSRATILTWAALSQHDESRYAVFRRLAKDLTHLVSVAEFCNVFELPVPENLVAELSRNAAIAGSGNVAAVIPPPPAATMTPEGSENATAKLETISLCSAQAAMQIAPVGTSNWSVEHDRIFLHPNTPAQPLATIAIPEITLCGQSRFCAGICLSNQRSAPVTFGVTVSTTDGRRLAFGQHTLHAQDTSELCVEFPRHFGLCEVKLTTAMDTSAGEFSNSHAWANFLNPRFEP